MAAEKAPGSTRDPAPDGAGTGRFAPAAALIAALALAALMVLPRLSFSKTEIEPIPAPGFVLPVIHNGEAGSRLSLADLKGSPVLLDFWATWCQPCAMQTPILDRLARRHQGKGLKVVGLNVHDDVPAMAQHYAQQKSLSYPIVVDGTGEIQRAYAVRTLPSLIIIDREGRIVHRTSGFVDEASLEKLLKDVL